MGENHLSDITYKGEALTIFVIRDIKNSTT